MAQFRAEKAGINADVQSKVKTDQSQNMPATYPLQLEAAYDEDLEYECRWWMEMVIKEPFPMPSEEEMDEIKRDFKGKEFYLALKDGLYLCK